MMSGESTEILSNYLTHAKIKTNSASVRTNNCLSGADELFEQFYTAEPRI